MEYYSKAILDNWEYLDDLGQKPMDYQDVERIIKAWGLECQNIDSNVKNVKEKKQELHLYLVK